VETRKGDGAGRGTDRAYPMSDAADDAVEAGKAVLSPRSEPTIDEKGEGRQSGSIYYRKATFRHVSGRFREEGKDAISQSFMRNSCDFAGWSKLAKMP
jgi:hypothetical protein